MKLNIGRALRPGASWRVLVLTLTALLALPADAGLETDIQQILSGAALGKTRTAVLLVDLTTGEPLVELDADNPMVPASNMKLITTAAALTRLGPDFKFSTRLSLIPPTETEAPASASARDLAKTATLPSLLIRGEGDPAFGDPVLLAQAGFEVDDLIDIWIKAIVDTGHTRFDQLLLDDLIFDAVRVHPDWPADQLHYYYCAQIGAINFHENVMAVLPVPSDAVGQSPIVQLFPYYTGLPTQNRATTGNVDDFRIQRPNGTNRFVFLGSVRNRRSEPYRVTVDDPAMFLGKFLQYKLKQVGIRVNRVVRVKPSDRVPEQDTEILHQLNTTLAGVIDRTNQDSQNMFAEALLKRMGHELTGEPGSFRNGASAVRLYLRDKLASRVGLTAVRVSDGSGLSPNNRATARVLVEVLSAMRQDDTLGPIFAASLSHAGHNGTLRQRLRDLRADVYGKSGYLGASANYASTLSGYIVRPDGRTYAFAMLFNGFQPPITSTRIKQVQDQILTKIDESISRVRN
ncbi:D-alanyl-D-alanine carboxypeptidase/D-alanyl-D-alanine endopeptidase [Algisphaera agarilytica]|uniref:D-alanyl-D-alanine carboxypeptidase/D-alanyl-D-alanine-endopeptidase (Penicillin-binding protein 4) n=1 Tax=Algisphaera agarilytica TaxID=1385975 RepID=A0A7X0H873_9BACT|nr:D-alanyl-D-alanine carboxypeptidase/D-alanyl-D-alanine-endopeptidase [Algisphaera agarilytica]MBB6429610.1 D-alanyl-D-alanine carboxypeptidase/D-alanyl-D-alanine-endopeptidase (penicillin-binding protein 4) [Algisphaera agarilytica]